ncbi:MAG: beta-galactosidase, partial [Chitinophagaceae bacterium]
MKHTHLFFLLFVALNSTAQEWKPAKVSLTTVWGEKVRPENAWTEYPRPQMQRKEWTNLNGLWKYAILEKGKQAPASFDGDILVPFCVESSLSGVGKALLPTQELWYKRTFRIPVAWTGKEILLHFDAVDWETTLWVNGKRVGGHKGGSDPFSFNISPFLKKSGDQEIVMSVWDPTDSGLQARGKQVLDPKGIWYTA